MKQISLVRVAVFTVVLFVVIFFLIAFSSIRNHVAEVGLEDNGYQIAIDNELMFPLDIEINNIGATIQRAYCDGLRVYMDICFTDDSNIDIKKTTLNDSDGNIFTMDEAIAIDKHSYALIWNCNLSEENVSLQFTTLEGITHNSQTFQFNLVEAPVLEIESFFEEMFIYTITQGTTSTLFDMEVHTLYEIDKFQIEIQDEVRTCVSMLKDVDIKHYYVIFPTIIETQDTIVIHALDKSGNILMSIPIRLGEMQ